MAGLARMHEHRRRAGGRQRRGDLASDVPTFSHAHHDDTAGALEHREAGAAEALVLARLQANDRARFDVEGLAREPQRAIGVEGGE